MNETHRNLTLTRFDSHHLNSADDTVRIPEAIPDETTEQLQRSALDGKPPQDQNAAVRWKAHLPRREVTIAVVAPRRRAPQVLLHALPEPAPGVREVGVPTSREREAVRPPRRADFRQIRRQQLPQATGV